MSLFILNNVGQPFGAFDGYDLLISTVLGGEVAQLVPYAVSGSDLAAKDVGDGYLEAPQLVRPIVTTTFTGGSGEGPFYLTDDGSSQTVGNQSVGYGTLFGVVVGGTAGQVVSGGTALGPSSATGSGKITLWKNPGLYGVTLNALNASLTPSAAVTVGTPLYYDATGHLCLSAQKVGSAVSVARAVEFSTGDTLVTTPKNLTRLGLAGGTLNFKYLVIDWNPPATS